MRACWYAEKKGRSADRPVALTPFYCLCGLVVCGAGADGGADRGAGVLIRGVLTRDAGAAGRDADDPEILDP
jgi:hypothetical protein